MTHLGTARNPMTEARRQHIFGKLVTLEQQAREAGEPSLAKGSAITIAVVGIAGLIIALWS